MGIIRKVSSLKNNSGLVKYLKNTSWLLAEKVIRLTVGLFVGIWVARYLGPESFGLFSYVQSFVGLFLVFSSLGLDGIVTRELVKNETVSHKLLGTAFVLKLVGSGVVFCLLYVTVFFGINDSQESFFVFIIATSTVFQSFNVIDFYFQSKVLSRYVVYSNLISLLVSSLIKVVLILTDAPLISFVYVVLLDSVVLTLGFIYFYFKTSQKILVWKFDFQIALSLLKDSWPLILSGFFISLYMKIDQVMIKDIMGNASVGQYAAAVRLSEAWNFIPLVISASFFPALVNAKKTSEVVYLARLQNLFDLLTWIAIAVAIPMTFLSDWVIELLYGSSYELAGPVLMVHIWTTVFIALGVARGKWIITENLQLYSLLYICIALISNVLLNILFIPIYGVIGAAVASLIAQAVGTLFAPSLFKKTRITFFMMIKSLLLLPSILRIRNE